MFLSFPIGSPVTISTRRNDGHIILIINNWYRRRLEHHRQDLKHPLMVWEASIVFGSTIPWNTTMETLIFERKSMKKIIHSQIRPVLLCLPWRSWKDHVLGPWTFWLRLGDDLGSPTSDPWRFCPRTTCFSTLFWYTLYLISSSGLALKSRSLVNVSHWILLVCPVSPLDSFLLPTLWAFAVGIIY